jgi:membrane protease YdiL (CAAX protease family)
MNKSDIKVLTILLYTAVACSLWKCFTLPATDFWTGEYKITAAIVLFGVIPMGIVKFIFREKLADYGLQLGITFRTVRSFLVMSPFVAVIAYFTGYYPAFFEVYPFNETLRVQNTGTPIGYGLFTFHSVLYLGYYFGWEFLFRGFIQHGLAKHCGVAAAIGVQTLASVMLHYGHPASEVFGALAAGLVWGYLTYRTKSILSPFGQHAVLGIVLDATLIYGRS